MPTDPNPEPLSKQGKQRKHFTAPETATVLAALRLWQTTEDPAERFEDHFQDHPPLDDKEIDALCEAINFHD